MYAVFRLVLLLIIIIYTQAISLFGERFHLNLQNPFIMWVICVPYLKVYHGSKTCLGSFFSKTSLWGEG